VQRTPGHAIELRLADLEQRKSPVGGQVQRLGDPLVGDLAGLAGDDVQGGRRDLRAQRLDDGIAAEQELR
jgi:hypothetical protein